MKKPVALSKGARAEMLVDGADSEEVSVEPLLELKTFHWGRHKSAHSHMSLAVEFVNVLLLFLLQSDC